MEPLRFVHAADLHIDSPFSGLRETAPAVVGERLRESTFEAFRNLVELCKSQRVDFVLIAGDVYDSADRSVRAQLRFRDGLAELAAAGIKSFVAHGNHDPLDGWQSAVRWPDGVRVFGPEPEWAAVERDGRRIAAIQGVSYPTAQVSDNLAARFAPPPGGDAFSIGLLHCNLGGDPRHDNYAPCTPGDLALPGIDYWALGHIHTRALTRLGPALAAYPGNIQGRHPNEPGARGCYLVEVDAGGSIRPSFHPLDVVRWERAEVGVDGLETLDDLLEKARAALGRILAAADGRDVVARLAFTGRGPIHAELAREDSLPGLLTEIRGGFDLSSRPWVWVERLTDATRPDLDLDRRAAQEDFLGLLLRRAAQALSDDARLAELTETVSAELRSNASAGLVDEPRPTDLAAWLDAARWRLAELLEPGAVGRDAGERSAR